MSQSSVPPRVRWHLSAVNGQIDVLVFDVERSLEQAQGREVAAAFVRDVREYRQRDDATYRGTLEIVGRYVELA